MNRMMHIIAAGVVLSVVTSTLLPMAANAALATNTVNGVQWQLNYDTSAKDVCVGGVRGGGNTGADRYAAHRAFISQYALNGYPLSIPATFTINGTDYTTTIVGNRSFYGGKFTSVVIPSNVVLVSYYAFLYCSNLKQLLLKGPSTVASGGTQSYKTVSFYGSVFGTSSTSGCTVIKLMFVGPNVKIGGTKGNFTAPYASGATYLLPSRTENTTWDAVTTSTVGGTNPVVVRYGPNSDCGYDFWMGDDTITAVPRTLEALQTVNGYASTFYSAFSHDTRYAVTNSIGTLTSDIYSGAGIDVMGEGEITFGLAAAFTGGVTASGTGTVAVNAGCRPGNGTVTLSDTATLKVAQSGTVTLGGALTAAEGTTLEFNFTDKETTPSLVLDSESSFASTVNVKISAADEIRPSSLHTYTLTSGFDFTGKTLKLATDSVKWAKSLSLDESGNIVLAVSDMALVVIVR